MAIIPVFTVVTLRRSDSQGEELATGLIQNPPLQPLSPWGDRRCTS
ncbi:hypothetical protein [Oscillatoria acuminata]|nr:hypothetical protein [Oscillatoria acuminata]